MFGSYPQSKVVDESLINILDNLDLDSNDNVTYKKQKYRKKVMYGISMNQLNGLY